MQLNAGDWVQVRSKEEILRTLGRDGCLDQLPFHPQMFDFCGKKMRIFKRAHKICDWVDNDRARRLEDSVLLENARCNGAGFAGCQTACLLIWKTAWLKTIDDDYTKFENTMGCSELDVERATIKNITNGKEILYRCQATEVRNFTKTMSAWNISQYAYDLSSKNITMWEFITGAAYFLFSLTRASKPRWGRPFRWAYDRFQRAVGGTPYPRRHGVLLPGNTPNSTLDLKVGEWVRIKSYPDILKTLDINNKNRGLFFDKEMVPFCGGIYRVKARVTNFIDERTGRPMNLKTDAIILEGVWCKAKYSTHRYFCPRAIYSWWREIWLERVESPMLDSASSVKRPLSPVCPVQQVTASGRYAQMRGP